MKKYFYLIIILAICNFLINNISLASDLKNEIIGTVNGENIYLKEFDRLYDTGKKKGAIDKANQRDIKEKSLNSIINKYLILQEAKTRKIQIPDTTLTQKLNETKQKLGGEANFKNFLDENNATGEDAKNEIKSQLLYYELKKQIPNLSSFLTQKRAKSKITIYKERIFPQVTIPNIEELARIERLKNNIQIELSKNIGLFNENLVPGTTLPTLHSLNAFKTTSPNLLEIKSYENTSQGIKELIKKIEQRRVTIKNE